MKESEAADIVRILTAGFHRESLDPETIQLWVEVMLPWDAEVATKLSLHWVKNSDTFPTLNQFRRAYLGEMLYKKDESPAVPVDAFGLPTVNLPDWVKRWKMARAADDMRVFPEQIADGPKWHDDPRYTLAEADEIGVMPDNEYPLDGR